MRSSVLFFLVISCSVSSSFAQSFLSSKICSTTTSTSNGLSISNKICNCTTFAYKYFGLLSFSFANCFGSGRSPSVDCTNASVLLVNATAINTQSHAVTSLSPECVKSPNICVSTSREVSVNSSSFYHGMYNYSVTVTVRLSTGPTVTFSSTGVLKIGGCPTPTPTPRPLICAFGNRLEAGLGQLGITCQSAGAGRYTVTIKMSATGCFDGNVCYNPALSMYAYLGVDSNHMQLVTQPLQCDDHPMNCFVEGRFAVTFSASAGTYSWQTYIAFTTDPELYGNDKITFFARGSFTVGQAERRLLHKVLTDFQTVEIPPVTNSLALKDLPAARGVCSNRAVDRGLGQFGLTCSCGARGAVLSIITMTATGCFDGNVCGRPALDMYTEIGSNDNNRRPVRQPNGCDANPERCFVVRAGGYAVTFPVTPGTYSWAAYITFTDITGLFPEGITYGATGTLTVGQDPSCAGTVASPTYKPTLRLIRTATKKRTATPTKKRTVTLRRSVTKRVTRSPTRKPTIKRTPSKRPSPTKRIPTRQRTATRRR
mmetsp:Transcript_20622/g.33969  ORF Transcript_20622/g.33969 Transcript_20622/m.33969 type:complete len:541 (+) Transcript_20622:190-1812(+)